MARTGGRNLAISWVAGLLCTAVIAGLIWFAIPIMPAMASFVGDGLRTLLP
ncbi:hypothetical protein [Microbacterium sp. SD291]|uniref:hypothetical protein n=1 Tax=Microbacterium sp. SD291 TaxID=2782007 RepID=UPI001A95DE05|nr:hypothetical protein [Microbacterium sp. SD291]MBO0980413.1 hypothetical protein [Microbacterium sp. SD291]